MVRSREDYCPKTVKFADGVLPGEGTSPSGGEEIHSPPPPITGTKGLTGKKREKRLRKKRKMKVKVIKLVSRRKRREGRGVEEIFILSSDSSLLCSFLFVHED